MLKPKVGELGLRVGPSFFFGRKACFQLQLKMLLGTCQGLAYRTPFPKSESLNVWDPHPHVLLKSLLLNMLCVSWLLHLLKFLFILFSRHETGHPNQMVIARTGRDPPRAHVAPEVQQRDERP